VLVTVFCLFCGMGINSITRKTRTNGQCAPHWNCAADQYFWCSRTALLYYCASKGLLRLPKQQEWSYLLGFALVATVLNQVLIYILSSHIEATAVTTVTLLESFIVCVLAGAMRLESIVLRRIVGLAIGLLGSAILYSVKVLSLPSLPTEVVALALIVPFSYALETIIVSKKPASLQQEYCIGMMLLISLPMLIASTLVLGQPMAEALRGPGFGLAGVAMMAVGLIANLSYFALVKNAGAIFAGQASYGMAVTGAFWGMVLHGESLDFSFVLATLLIIAGLILVGTCTPTSQEVVLEHKGRDPAPPFAPLP
jgi:drug/metabolite transporter (DMT)-like permease